MLSQVQAWGRHKAHVSWHITSAFCGVLLGTAVIPLAADGLLLGREWLVASIFLLAPAVVIRRRFLLVLALVSGVIVGLFRGGGLAAELSKYEIYHGQNVSINGKVSDDTVYGPDGDQRLKLSEIRINSTPLAGEVWTSTSSSAEIKRGDYIVLEGQLSEGFGNMSASVFRAELISIQHPVPGDVARRLRDRFSTFIQNSIPEPQSFLAISYLFGQRHMLPEELGEQLRILGLTHVVVASGFHLTVIIRVCRRFLAKISKYLAVLGSFLAIGSFLLLTGFSTSMTRASLVAGISLLAWYYGRTIHPVTLILVVAGVTVLADPSTIWADVGWYLSFSAFAGVIILSPLLYEYFFQANKKPGTFTHIVLATTAAQITTFPVIAYVFGQYSPLALVSNLLILPLVPITMMLTFLTGLAGAINSTFGVILGLPAHWLLQYMTSITDKLSSSPYAYGSIDFGIPELLLSYAVIVALIIYLWHKTKHNYQLHNPID